MSEDHKRLTDVEIIEIIKSTRVDLINYWHLGVQLFEGEDYNYQDRLEELKDRYKRSTSYFRNLHALAEHIGFKLVCELHHNRCRWADVLDYIAAHKNNELSETGLEQGLRELRDTGTPVKRDENRRVRCSKSKVNAAKKNKQTKVVLQQHVIRAIYIYIAEKCDGNQTEFGTRADLSPSVFTKIRKQNNEHKEVKVEETTYNKIMAYVHYLVPYTKWLEECHSPKEETSLEKLAANLEGFLTGFNNIQQVIDIIKESETSEKAATDISNRLTLTAEQTKFLLFSSLGQLAKDNRAKYADKLAKVLAELGMSEKQLQVAALEEAKKKAQEEARKEVEARDAEFDQQIAALQDS